MSTNAGINAQSRQRASDTLKGACAGLRALGRGAVVMSILAGAGLVTPRAPAMAADSLGTHGVYAADVGRPLEAMRKTPPGWSDPTDDYSTAMVNKVQNGGAAACVVDARNNLGQFIGGGLVGGGLGYLVVNKLTGGVGVALIDAALTATATQAGAGLGGAMGEPAALKQCEGVVKAVRERDQLFDQIILSNLVEQAFFKPVGTALRYDDSGNGQSHLMLRTLHAGHIRRGDQVLPAREIQILGVFNDHEILKTAVVALSQTDGPLLMEMIDSTIDKNSIRVVSSSKDAQGRPLSSVVAYNVEMNHEILSMRASLSYTWPAVNPGTSPGMVNASYGRLDNAAPVIDASGGATDVLNGPVARVLSYDIVARRPAPSPVQTPVQAAPGQAIPGQATPGQATPGGTAPVATALPAAFRPAAALAAPAYVGALLSVDDPPSAHAPSSYDPSHGRSPHSQSPMTPEGW